MHLRCTTCVSTCRWTQLCAFHAHACRGAAHHRCAAHEVDRAAPLSRTQDVRTRGQASPADHFGRSRRPPPTPEGCRRERRPFRPQLSPCRGSHVVRLRRTAPRAREARTAGLRRQARTARRHSSSASGSCVTSGDMACSPLLSQATDPRSTSARPAEAGGPCLTCIYAFHPRVRPERTECAVRTSATSSHRLHSRTDHPLQRRDELGVLHREDLGVLRQPLSAQVTGL